MDLTNVHHIAIIASSYEKSYEFYVNQLGFRVKSDIPRPERNDRILNLALKGLELELFIKSDAPARPNYPEALGLRHLAFRVESVEKAVEWLSGRGIQCEPIRMDPYANCAMTFFHDPDGLPLELHE